MKTLFDKKFLGQPFTGTPAAGQPPVMPPTMPSGAGPSVVDSYVPPTPVSPSSTIYMVGGVAALGFIGYLALRR